ncbi:MAG: PEP-utilizing enzyme [Magnetococcus sp. DMHC-6]
MISRSWVRISAGMRANTAHFGEKGRRLVDLSQAGFPVPDGILLSVECLEQWFFSAALAPLFASLEEREGRGETGLEGVALAGLAAIPVPVDWEQEVRGQLEEMMAGQGGGAGFFAVRSAAIGEDAGHSSFAGQYATCLEIPLEKIWSAILEVYASWWADRSVSYRHHQGIVPSRPRMSIIVQRQLQADYAGVLFTRNPLDGSSTFMIEAVRGLGEALVSGQVTPARWQVDPVSHEIIRMDPDPSGAAMGMGEGWIGQLVAMGLKLQKKFGQDLDLEWGIEAETLYLLQMRPITTLATPAGSMALDIYSRAIVEDLWSDRMTPMTASIIFTEFGDIYTFKKPLIALGLHKIAQVPAIRVVNGFGYLHAEVLYQLLDVLPKNWRFSEVAKGFPPELRSAAMARSYRVATLGPLLLRAPLLLSDPAALPFLTIPLLRRQMRKVDRQLALVSPVRYVGAELSFFRQELERLLGLLESLLVRNQWGYGYAAVFTWLLRHVALGRAAQSESWLLEQLAWIPNNITQQMQHRLLAIVRAMPDELQELFKSADRVAVWQTLQERFADHPFSQELAQFLVDFGYRSANRDFIHPRWQEKPEQVLDLIGVLLQSDLKASRFAFQETARLNMAALPWRSRWVMIYLLKQARQFLALREDLRCGLDRVFHQLRQLLLAMVNAPPFECLGADKDQIFFMELSELRRVLQGGTIDQELFSLVRERARLFRQEAGNAPPQYIKITAKGEVLDLERPVLDDHHFLGTAAASGLAEGRAVVVRDASEFYKLKPGDILIAHNTDPGWTSLFLSAAGVVVEMGGILNHCAIIAREYGVPAVVGVSKVTQRIRDGQWVRVNGESGVVEVLEDSPTSTTPPPLS